MASKIIKCLGGYEIDPETCPIEELERVCSLCKREEDYWNTMQLSAKTFINSVYGVFGTTFFNLSNIDLAESITLQGQDLIKYSVRMVDGYFKEMWHTDYEGHKRVSDIMINEYNVKDFDRERFEREARNPLDFKTLQAYGDSVAGDSEIMLDGGITMKIEDMFNECCSSDCRDKIRVTSDRKVVVLGKDGYPLSKKINYIMRHMTGKQMYRIVDCDGRHIDVTEDHSVMIITNDNNIIEAKPSDIDIETSRLIVLNKNASDKCVYKKIQDICLIENDGSDNYVYDISVMTDDAYEHTFFANGICVHNTDSVSGDTIVRTEKHPDGIPIKDLYEENADNNGDVTLAGHESVNTDDKVLNAYNGELYNAGIKRIIKHKVRKKKWKIVTSDGKCVFCTADHSLVVIRDGKEVVIKPNELKKGDKFITLK